MHPAGQGDLHAQFEHLRDQLKAEGLFDPDRKRSLPPFPSVLGIVTSPQAAQVSAEVRSNDFVADRRRVRLIS